MKEELTTKMHSEFSVSEETDLKHKCFNALECIDMFSYSIEKACAIYEISADDLEKYRKEYELLSSK